MPTRVLIVDDEPNIVISLDFLMKQQGYETATAEDGLLAVTEAARFLNPDGTLVVEVGHNRAATELAFPQLPFVWLETQTSSDSVFLLKREALIAGR